MNYTIQMSPMVTLTKMNGQTVLFSKATGDFFGLNPTANYLVEELLKSDFVTASRKAAGDFGVEENVIQNDLQEVVASLVEAKLVVKQPVAESK